MAILSARQTRVWRDTPTLFAHNVAVNPDSYAGYSNLATFAYREAEEETDRRSDCFARVRQRLVPPSIEPKPID